MNGISHQNNENLTLYEGFPPQGLSEARRAGGFFKIFLQSLKNSVIFFTILPRNNRSGPVPPISMLL